MYSKMFRIEHTSIKKKINCTIVKELMGICGGQSGAGAGFLLVLRFPLPIFIPPISPQSPSPFIRRWYNRPVSGHSTQSPTPLIKKKSRPPVYSVYRRDVVMQTHSYAMRWFSKLNLK
jgi:hypothetical protein